MGSGGGRGVCMEFPRGGTEVELFLVSLSLGLSLRFLLSGSMM